MRGTFPIGRVLGIPILVNPTWFASLFLIVGILSLQVFPGVFPGQNAALYWMLGLTGGLVFFLSVILHELGHCVVARHYAVPVKSITLFIFGGVSQITREAPRARAEMLIAFAGPGVSLILGGSLLALRLFVFTADTPGSLLLEWLGEINLVLGVFNLLPGFPLDGGRLLRACIWGISGNFRMATRLAALLGRLLSFGLIGAGVGAVLQLPYWLHEGPLGGLWLIMVGLFLNNAAGQTQAQSRMLAFLRRYRADQVMAANVPIVAASASLRSVAYGLPAPPAESICFVATDGHVVGLLSRDRLAQVPADRWSTTTAAELMIPSDQIVPASPDLDVAALLQRLDAEGLPGLPVVRDGTVEGLVTRTSAFGLLRGHREFRFPRR